MVGVQGGDPVGSKEAIRKNDTVMNQQPAHPARLSPGVAEDSEAETREARRHFTTNFAPAWRLLWTMTTKPYAGSPREEVSAFAKHDRGMINDACGPGSDWRDITPSVARAVATNRPPSSDFDHDDGFRCFVTLFNPWRFHGTNEYSVFACVHGRTTVRAVRTGAKRRLSSWAKEQLALVMHTWGFRCDCIRPAWEHHFRAPLTRRTLADLRAWVASLQAPDGGFRLETEWAKRVGRLSEPWCLGDGVRQFSRR
jgi:hypothetical protein